MGRIVNTGHAQRRKLASGDLGLTEVKPMNRIFTMKADDAFYGQLEKLIGETPGDWSYAAMVRRVVAEAAGAEQTEVVKVPKQYPHQPTKREKVQVVAGSEVKEKSYSPEQVQAWLDRLRGTSGFLNSGGRMEPFFLNFVLKEQDPEQFVKSQEERDGGREDGAVDDDGGGSGS